MLLKKRSIPAYVADYRIIQVIFRYGHTSTIIMMQYSIISYYYMVVNICLGEFFILLK